MQQSLTAESSGLPWAMVLAAGLVLGTVITAVLLRLRVARAAARRKAPLDSGELLWWSRVRERRGKRGWGLSGELSLGADGRLRLVPDAGSQRRGDRPEAWAMDEIEFSFGPSKRDIIGVTYTTLTVRSKETGRTRELGCTSQRGHIPAELGRGRVD